MVINEQVNVLPALVMGRQGTEFAVTDFHVGIVSLTFTVDEPVRRGKIA